GVGGSNGSPGSNVPAIAAANANITLTGGGVTTANSGTGQVYGRNISFTATAGSGGTITFKDAVTGTSSVTMSADGAGAVSDPTGAAINTPTLTLTSGSGNIGTTLLHIITTKVGTLSATTTGAGDVFIDNSNTSLTLGTSSAGGTFQLTNTGTLTVNVSGSVTAGSGDLRLSSVGNLTVQSGQLTSTSGKVVLSASGG